MGTTLYLRQTDRWDSGFYNLKVVVGNQVANARFNVAIIDTPSKPRALKITDVVGTSAQLKWNMPADDGNTDILGYQVEKKDVRDDMWYVCVDRVRHTNVRINDLIIGNKYNFRIKAINELGLSEAGTSKDIATIEKEVSKYTKPERNPLDFSTKPKITQPLNDRKIMVGYNGVITCALSGFPKPKIRWFKGKVELIDNPKYTTSHSQGIVQLELRRARPGDAGRYKMIADNPLGTVECDCAILVKDLKDEVPKASA